MFLAPWFLAGLLAIGVPIWLHRIARSERIKVPFASLMLLEASEVRDTSRRNIRYWVLLAVRIALLVLLALAFAQPLFKSGNAALNSTQAQLHAVVLDTSLSMQYEGRWQRAIEQAQAIIANMKSTDRALLVTASGRKIELAAGPVLGSDAGVLRAALTTLKPGLDRLDYGMLMTSSSVWLSADGWFTHLHFITDLQQSASPLRFADLAAPANTQIEIHDVRAAPASNFAIVAATVQAAPQSDDGRIFTATVRALADASAAGNKTVRELVLTIDNQSLPAKRVVVDSTGTAQIAFTAPKLRAGNHRLRFDLRPNDALPQDDSFFAVIEHTEPAVLLIAPDPAADEAAYLAAAIESQSAMHLTVTRTTPQTLAKTLATKPLGDFSAVFVTDSGILGESAARQLNQYVAAGGALLATLGPRAAQLKVEPITGMVLRKTSDNELRVGSVDDSHPVLRDAGGWHAVRFMKHLGVQLTDQDRALITLSDQSPLLIERSESAGRLLVLTAPLDRTWNDLAIHPLFVRFIADTARYLTDRDANAMAYPIGARIATGLTAGTGGQIFDPQGGRVLALDDASQASHLTPNQVGFYEVRSGQEKHWLAVNVDVRESDLTPMHVDNVARWQALTAAPALKPVPVKPAKGPVDLRERPIGWNLLIAAAVFLLIELLLANYRLTIRRDGTRATRDTLAAEVS